MTIKEFEKNLELKEKRISDWEIFGLVPKSNELEDTSVDLNQLAELTVSDKYTFLFDSNGELNIIEL